MTIVNAEATVGVTSVATVSAKLRVNLALHHLISACRYSNRIKCIEIENKGQPFGDFWEEVLQHSLAVCTLTVASLEGFVNEVYFEGGILKSTVNDSASIELSEILERESILRKYSVALSLVSGKRLDMGEAITQNISALIKLRNAIVHFCPEWMEEQDKHEKLSKLLEHKFHQSEFLAGEPIFPRAWASHSFSVWAISSTINFIDYFYNEISQPSVLDPFRDRLKDF